MLYPIIQYHRDIGLMLCGRAHCIISYCIKSYHIVRNNKNINLVSKLRDDESFRVSFNIDYVKPISSALLSETIVIYAHEAKPLMFSILMDKNSVEIKILTEIIDDRNA